MSLRPLAPAHARVGWDMSFRSLLLLLVLPHFLPLRASADRLLRRVVWLAFAFASAAVWWPVPAHAVRIKEVATVQGVRSNVVGYKPFRIPRFSNVALQ